MNNSFLFLAGLFAASLSLSAQNIVRDPGFEEGDRNWNHYIPADSKERGCAFSIVTDDPHSGGACALLESRDYGRISISPKGMPMPVRPGEKFRLIVWIKAGVDFKPERNQPGLVLRIDLMRDRESVTIVTADWKGKVTLLSPSDRITGFPPEPVPSEWTPVEVTFTIPEGINAMRPGLFLWRASGQLRVDDFVLERVTND